MQSILAKPTLSLDRDSRIALLSHRQQSQHVSQCFIYEFEDLIAEVEKIDIFAPTKSYQLSRRINNLINRFTKSKLLANLITPPLQPIVLDQEYQLFFSVIASPYQVFALNYLPKNWRDKCQTAVCYLIETWDTYLEGKEYLLEPLKHFDHIFLGHSNTVEAVARITGKPCSYLPPSVDTLKFCPYPNPPQRSIDVCSIGRRSSITHEALLELAQKENRFYHYDTIRNLEALDTNEHRSFTCNLLKRSRYFLTNKPNVNENFKTKGKEEIGYRFFEGAAAGTVMIGEHPTHEEFYKNFYWPDAAIRVPYNSNDIGKIIAELDSQPERLAKIRKDNIVNSLLRHDFVYRWREILETVGIEPTPKMLHREAKLKKLSEIIHHHY